MEHIWTKIMVSPYATKCPRYVLSISCFTSGYKLGSSHCTPYKKLNRKRNFCGGCGPSETPNSCSSFKGGGVPAGFFWKIKYDIFYDMA